jgi:hypothetical protein
MASVECGTLFLTFHRTSEKEESLDYDSSSSLLTHRSGFQDYGRARNQRAHGLPVCKYLSFSVNANPPLLS